MPHSRIKRWMIAGALLITLASLTWAHAQGGGGNITYGQTTSGTLKAGAADTWHFIGTGSDVIAIKVERTSGDLEPVLMLQDSAQQPIAGTQAASGQGTVSLVMVRLPQSGSYLISIRGDGNTGGDYRLTLTLSTPSAQTPTPEPQSASAVNAGDVVIGGAVHGEISDKIFRQLWHFRANFGDVLDIKMTRQSGDLSPVLALVSPIGDIVAASDSPKGAPEAGILGLALPFTGDYTIIARREGTDLGRNGSTSGQYSLTVASRGANTAALNTLLIPGNTLSGRLNENAPVAVYRLENGGALAVMLDLGSLHRLAQVRILNPAGQVLVTQQGISPLIVPAHLPDKGPYLVEATSYPFENQPFTDFAITVFRLSANIAKASTDPQTLHYGDKRQTTAADSNNWVFKGHTGDIISLALTPDVIGMGAQARLSGPQDILLYQGNLAAGVRLTVPLPTDGIYEIEIRPADSSTPVAYELDLNRVGANFNAFGLFAVAVDQGPLGVNAPVNGVLKAGAADAWWLDATAGQVINLTANTATGSGALGLALRRPDGSPVDIQITDRVQGVVIQQAILDQTGRYRVVVFDSAGKTGGGYTLRYEDAHGGRLQVGQPVKGLAVPSDAYSDWSLDVVAGSLINLRLDSLTPKSWSPSLAIADPGGHVIATSPSTAGSRVELLGVTAPLTGTYHVIVGGQVAGTFASYDLLANVQSPFGVTAPIKVSMTEPPVIRYAGSPSNGPVHPLITDLISPLINTDQPTAAKPISIALGATMRGEIGRGKFSQIWQFEGLHDMTIGLTATSLTGNVGPDLLVLDSTGKIVHEQLHADDATTALTFQVPQSGNYRILVRMGLNGGRYLLSLNQLPVTGGNLQVSPGTPLAYGQTASGEISAQNTADLYSFLGSSNDLISLTVVRSTGDLAPALRLLAPNGTEVAKDANASAAPSVGISSYRLPDTGVFTIAVQHAQSSPNSAGRYVLYLGVASGFRLSNRGSGLITPGETVNGLLVPPDNEDTWLFKGSSGQRATFTLSGLGDPPTAPLGLRLQDTTGKTFAAQEIALTQGALRLTDVMLPSDGIYRVQVTGATTTAGAYSLTWQPEPERLLPGPLRYNQTVSGVFSATRNADTWVFSGTAGDIVSIALEFERGDRFAGAFQLRSENGLTLATEADLKTGAGARVDNLLLPFSGSYTLVVANPDTAYKGAGVYSLTVDLQDSKARSMGTVLAYGQQGTGDIYLDDAVDTWTFGARGGDVIRISALAQDQFLKPSVELRTPGGVLLAAAQADSTQNNGEAQIGSFKIVANGVYVISVSGGKNKSAGSYRLSLDNVPPPVAENATLNYGDSKEGLIANDRPSQSFAFSGRRGDSITAKVTREPGSQLAVLLTIVDDEGKVLAQADANGGESAELPDFKLPKTGRYMIVVSRFYQEQGQTSGRFTVALTGAPGPRPIKGKVNYGQQAIGRLNDETPAERISFTGRGGDVIGVISHATSGDLDTVLTLENSAGTILATNDDVYGSPGTDATIAGVLLPVDDTYSVVISRAGTATIGSGGNYELFVNRLYQLNATAAPKNLVGYGQRVVGSVDPATVEQRYAFSGNQDDEVGVQLVHQMDEAPPFLTILDSADTVLAQGKLTNGQTAIDRYRLPISGLYTISVKRPLDAKQIYSPYALTLTLLDSLSGRASTGGVIGLGDAVTGDFRAGQAGQSGQQAHYWLFQAQAKQTITLNLLPLSGGALPSAILIGPNGQGIRALADNSPSSAAPQFILPSDGIYTVLVLPGGSESGGSGGQYRLTIQPTNNATAAPLRLTAGQTVSGTIDNMQPEQRWSFNGQPGQSVTARVLVTSGTLTPQLSLQNPAGQIVAEGHIERTSENMLSAILTANLPAAGTYTLVVSPQPSLTPTSGAYRLSLEMGNLSPQAVAASPIAYGQPVHQAIQQDARDLWTFTGTAGDAVSVAVVADSGKAPGVALQDASGRVLVQVPPSNSVEANIEGFSLPADGRYVLVLSSPATLAYTLTVQRRQDALAVGVNPRGLVVDNPLDGEISSQDPINYWGFTAKAGDVIQIEGGRLNGNVRIDTALYGPSGFITSAIADATKDVLRLGPVRLAEDGKYVLVVSSYIGTATRGRYTLLLSNPKGASGSKGGAITIYGQSVVGGITSSDDNDTWTFDGQAGDVIDIRMTRTDGNLVPAFKLLDATGKQELASAKAEKSEALLSRFILPTTGKYNIVATRADSSSGGGYRLAVQRVQTALQASLSRAGGIGYNEDRNAEITKDSPGRAWVFFGKAGDRVTVEVAPSGGGVLDPFAYLIAPDGSTLAADDNSGGNRSALIANVLLPGDGFYGIVVIGSPVQQAEQQFGAFTLSLRRDQPGAAYQGTITVGSSVGGALSGDQPIQEWVFQAGGGKTIAAHVTSPSAMFATSLMLVTQDGKLLASGATRANGTASIEAPLPGPGWYAVLISANSSGAAGQYQLAVNYALAPSGGGAMISGEPVQGTIDDADFTDLWRIELKAGATVSLDLARLSNDLDVDLALYGPDGTLIPIQVASGNPVHVQGIRVEKGGTYVLMVSRKDGAAGHTTGDYKLQVSAS